MLFLTLVGIGTGNPEHLTLAAIRALNAADVVLIPRKGEAKGDLADLRRTICGGVITNPHTRLVEFDLPIRDANGDYRSGVVAWHEAIAAVWQELIAKHLGSDGRVALLIWGDPSLYDSSLRIAAQLNPVPKIEVIPGITAIQALCAAHAIPLNEIGAPVLVTTGRRLRDGGWPHGADTVAVMLDAATAFEVLDPANIHIWWGAYLGMPEEITLSGPLSVMGPKIASARRDARNRHGWIMDTYLLKRLVSA
jgi:precorrin-6A synthase